MCHHEQAVGLQWKTTNAGSFDEIPCPKKAKGKETNSKAVGDDDMALLILSLHFRFGEKKMFN